MNDNIKEYVILVDRADRFAGQMEKMEAHRKAELHRAFSVFVLNSDDQLILQRRAMKKYHSPGLWTNTCCSHPRPGEETEQAAHRRLQEEMGFDCALEKVFDFVYRADVGKGLTEYEFDHVFFGRFDEVPVINTDEAMDWKSMSLDEIKEDMDRNPADYTIWFRIAFQRFHEFVRSL